MSRLAFHEALDETWNVIRAADAYIDHQAPWSLRKTDHGPHELRALHACAVLRVVGVVLQPFMPDTMGKLLDYLGVGADRSLAILDTPLAEGTPLPAPAGLFPRVVEAA